MKLHRQPFNNYEVDTATLITCVYINIVFLLQLWWWQRWKAVVAR